MSLFPLFERDRRFFRERPVTAGVLVSAIVAFLFLVVLPEADSSAKADFAGSWPALVLLGGAALFLGVDGLYRFVRGRRPDSFTLGPLTAILAIAAGFFLAWVLLASAG